MKINAPWIQNPELQALFNLYERNGYQLYAVGGCVRNALLETEITDIDLCSDALPQTAMDFLSDARIRTVPTGIDHGTFTVIAEPTSYEITTFRKDVETDGRHAVVAFSTKITDDARRRDFTINALYVDRHGQIIDPINGFRDIHPLQIRFIGDAEARIKEDYLRILRFFRFHAQYASANDGFDPDALAAIAATKEGLRQLSKERVTAEMTKILATLYPLPAVSVMARLGLFQTLKLDISLIPITHLLHWEEMYTISPDPIRRYAALLGQDQLQHFRLRKTAVKMINALRTYAISSKPDHEIGYRLGAEAGRDALLLRAAFLEQSVTQTRLAAVETGARAKFPIKAADLQSQFQGPALGARLTSLERDWIDAHFQLTKDQLLQ